MLVMTSIRISQCEEQWISIQQEHRGDSVCGVSSGALAWMATHAKVTRESAACARNSPDVPGQAIVSRSARQRASINRMAYQVKRHWRASRVDS